jgi:2-oxo-hept-3-ene-1,7-dioate hydratase
MIIDEEEAARIAERLDEAERTQTATRQISSAFEGMTIEDAYAVQRAWVARKLARGRTVIGHKIGLTSRAMQRASGITEPDFGVLLDDMLEWSGARLDSSAYLVPRLEVEVALKLGAPLRGPGVTLLDVLDATEWVMPALELIDARIEIEDRETGARRQVLDTIADNAANAAIILGGQPVRPDDVDMARIAATLHRNEVIEESGVAAAVLGHPATGVAWLANRLAQQGEGLAAGEIVLGGSFTAPVPARPGDSFYANYGDLGVIAVAFD